MYLTVHDVDSERIRGAGFGNGLGTSGLRRAPLNFYHKEETAKENTLWCGPREGSW